MAIKNTVPNAFDLRLSIAVTFSISAYPMCYCYMISMDGNTHTHVHASSYIYRHSLTYTLLHMGLLGAYYESPVHCKSKCNFTPNWVEAALPLILM